MSVSFLRVNGLKRRCRHRLDTPLDLKLRIYGCVSKAGALIWKSDVRKLITKNGSSSHWWTYVKKSENSWMDDLFRHGMIKNGFWRIVSIQLTSSFVQCFLTIDFPNDCEAPCGDFSTIYTFMHLGNFLG